MRIAYGDLIGGVSGDMFVAALLDLGVSLNTLASELKKIPTLKFKLQKSHKTVHGIRATRFHVICPEKESDRSWKQIRSLITRSKLHADVKDTGIKIFSRLAEAEGKIHGVPTDDAHFHESRATGAILDRMPAATGCCQTQVEHFSVSRVSIAGVRQSARCSRLA